MHSEKKPRGAARAFISSTVEDLKSYRAAARDAAIAAHCLPDMQEYFAASGHRPPLDACLARVTDCDVLVVILGHRYGWIPNDQESGEGKSITWLECERARYEEKEVLAFVVDEATEWPPEQRESFRVAAAVEADDASSELLKEVQQNLQRLRDFKSWVSRIGIRNTFANPDDLARKVERALGEWRERHLEFGKPVSEVLIEQHRETASVEDLEREPEESLLDLVEKGNQEFSVLTQVTLRIAQDIDELGAKAKLGTESLQAATGKTGVDATQAKRLVNTVAEAIMRFANRLDADIVVFEAAVSKGFEAVEKASNLAPDFARKGFEGLQRNLVAMQVFSRTVPSTKQSIASFRNSVANLPRLTTKLNKAKRACVEALDALQRDCRAFGTVRLRFRSG